jgi:hypothetical protein
MGKNLLVGVGGRARHVKALYVGIGGKARKVKKVYVGVGGKARLVYQSYIPVTGISVIKSQSFDSFNVWRIEIAVLPTNATNKSTSWDWAEGPDAPGYLRIHYAKYPPTDTTCTLWASPYANANGTLRCTTPDGVIKLFYVKAINGEFTVTY